MDAETPREIPFYIHAFCDCGERLVLADPLRDPDIDEDNIWYDEWECPKCCDGIHLDWSKEELNDLVKRTEEATVAMKNGEIEAITLDDLLGGLIEPEEKPN
jgi:hypothetical protein